MRIHVICSVAVAARSLADNADSRGDITHVQADAIVNAANTGLLGAPSFCVWDQPRLSCLGPNCNRINQTKNYRPMQVVAGVRNRYSNGVIDAILTNRSDSGRSHTQSSRT